MARQRPPWFPPAPAPYDPPASATPGYVLARDGSVQGFGRAGFFLAAIPRATAVEIIRRHHYSRRIVNNSFVHLGVYFEGALSGALQLGPMLVPRACAKLVAGTGLKEHLELNRMWLAEACPPNSESQALRYAFAYLKRACPRVAWVQSFADERCGRWGAVYQAASFKYLGCHATVFYELDGETYHEMLLTAHRGGGIRSQHLIANLHRARAFKSRQFRYIFFLKPRAARRLLRRQLPYPKPNQDPLRGRS